MKKYLLLLALLPLNLLATDRVVVADPAAPNQRKITTMTVTSNQITGTNAVAAIAVVGTSSSIGAGDSGNPIKANASGKLDPTFLNTSTVLTTNLTSKTGGSAYTWFTITTLTTTATNGNVVVTGRAIAPSAAGYNWLRIRDASNNVFGQTFSMNSGNTSVHQMGVAGVDSLTGTTKVYTLEAASITASVVFTNAAASTASDPGATDGMGMRIEQHQ